MLYVMWALWRLDVPGMPNPRAAEIGFIGIWAFFTLNLLGGAIFVVVSQICWWTGTWFYGSGFQSLDTATFAVTIGFLLACGIGQWLLVLSLARIATRHHARRAS